MIPLYVIDFARQHDEHALRRRRSWVPPTVIALGVGLVVLALLAGAVR
jgi:hypothetical protein